MQEVPIRRALTRERERWGNSRGYRGAWLSPLRHGSAGGSLSLEHNSMINSGTHGVMALASSKVDTRSERVIGQVTVNDQNQRR
jgi:hypothetical protein